LFLGGYRRLPAGSAGLLLGLAALRRPCPVTDR